MEGHSMANESREVWWSSSSQKQEGSILKQIDKYSMNNEFGVAIGSLSEHEQEGSTPVVQEMEDEQISNNFEEVVGASCSHNQECSTPLQNMDNDDEMVNSNNMELVVGDPEIDLTQHFVTDQVFDTRDEMIAWCQDAGKRNNMVLVIAKSQKAIPGRRNRIRLGCERGGVLRPHTKKDQTNIDLFRDKLEENKKTKRRRNRGTKKCGCPFTLRGIWLPGDKWSVKVECGKHNHMLDKTQVGHSFAGKLKDDEKQLVKEMMNNGIEPKEVLKILKQRNEGNMSTMRTIYNAKTLMRLADIEGRSKMQQFVKLLDEYHYVKWHNNDVNTNEVKDIFWSHPKSIQLAKKFPSVLVVDCTYQTNRYQMPLVEIIGFTPMGKTFTVAFVFMEAETEEHYTWALHQIKTIYEPNETPSVFMTDRVNALMNAIDIVFPKADYLLCTSRIIRNISVNCKDNFDTTEEFNRFLGNWEELMHSETPLAFDKGFFLFEHEWASYPTCIQYIRDTWLDQREHFVAAWTNKIKHYGHTTTECVVSVHTRMSNMLGLSQSTFLSCWTTIHSSITNEITSVMDSLEESLKSVKESHNLPVLQDLRNHVSHLALDMLVAEHSRGEYINFDSSICECTILFTHGLPCVHKIMQFERDGQSIPIVEVDSHWRIFPVLSIMPSNPDDLPEFDLFKRKWDVSSEAERCTMLKKLKEITTPTIATQETPETPET